MLPTALSVAGAWKQLDSWIAVQTISALLPEYLNDPASADVESVGTGHRICKHQSSSSKHDVVVESVTIRSPPHQKTKTQKNKKRHGNINTLYILYVLFPLHAGV